MPAANRQANNRRSSAPRKGPVMICPPSVVVARCAHAFIKARTCLQGVARPDPGMLTRSAATMKVGKVKFAYLVCAGALLAGHALAEEGGKTISKTTISLGTATPGGGFPLYGN